MRRQVLKGNVVLPKDLAREKYVEYCFRTHTVSVITENGEFLKNCPVAYNFCGVNEGFFYSLDIPKTVQEYGTRVLLIYLEEQNMAIVIGCLQDGKNLNLTEEFQMILMRRTEGNSFKIRGSGLRGVVDILAQGTGENTGKINLKAYNDLQEGELNFATDYLYLVAKQSMNFTSNKIFELYVKNKVEQDEFNKLSWELGVGFILEDEFGNKININTDGFTFTGKDGGTFKINGGNLELNGNSYSIPLGEKLKTELEKEKSRVTAILTTLINWTPVPGDGGAALKAAIVLASQPLTTPDYSNVLSSKNKLS